MFWAMHSGIVAAIATVFARYVAVFVPLGTTGMRLVAIAVIAVISGVNYLGVRQGSLVQTAFTVVKVVAVVAIIVIGFTLGKAAPDTVPATAGAGIAFRDIALAMIAGLFAFGGWHMVTYAAEETRDPERTIPRALVIGTLLVTACYIALNAVYFHVLPLATVVASTRVAADAADAVFGSGGAVTMAALVAFSTFGALSGIILSGPRVYQSMARDGLLFSWVGELHPRFKTPHRAILLQAIWSAVLVSTGTYRTLFSLVVYTEWIFFGLMAGGLYILRRRADYAPPYRTWGYPLTPAIFIASTAFIVLNQVMSDPRQSALGLLLVAAGWPIHQLWLKRRNVPRRHAIGHAD
jgi:APA family basic amino acid/polyamine antiporter